jgi:hypothetical protein
LHKENYPGEWALVQLYTFPGEKEPEFLLAESLEYQGFRPDSNIAALIELTIELHLLYNYVNIPIGKMC